MSHCPLCAPGSHHTFRTHPPDSMHDLRHGMGLPTFRHLKSLEEAEKNHAYYLADVYEKYGVILGHKEDNATYPSPYYTGHTTLSRARHMHYDGDTVLGGLSYSPEHEPMIFHIRALMTAIYHRFLITNPGADEVGLYASRGLSPNTGQVDVGMHVETQVKNELASPAVIVYPFDGETDVSRYFMGETPDPLKEQEQHSSGMPVTVEFNERYIHSIDMLSMELFDPSGAPVALLLTMDAKNDPNHRLSDHQFAVFPENRLLPAARYTVTIHYRADGKDLKKTWHFTTGENDT